MNEGLEMYWCYDFYSDFTTAEAFCAVPTPNTSSVMVISSLSPSDLAVPVKPCLTHMVFTATPAAQISNHLALVGGRLLGIVTRMRQDVSVSGSEMGASACGISRGKTSNESVDSNIKMVESRG